MDNLTVSISLVEWMRDTETRTSFYASSSTSETLNVIGRRRGYTGVDKNLA